MNSAYHAFGLLLAQVWGDGVQSRVLRPIGPDASGLMLAADPQGRRHLLAPVAENRAFQEQIGETLTLAEWQHDGRRYLDLACGIDSLGHVFASLADDVVRRVAEKNEDPADALLGALAEWRRLLKSAQTLSEEQSRGLFGELVVLKALVERNPQYALDVWGGPDSDLHDFTSPNGDIEVKTSSADGMAVVVSSLHQLDPQQDRPLVLIRLQLATSPNGKNIGDMVDELADAGLVRSELIARLASVGFLLGSDPDPHRFVVVNDPIAWRVTKDFPGLRASDLPEVRINAIRRVRYTLDLVAAPEPLSMDELDDYLTRVVET